MRTDMSPEAYSAWYQKVVAANRARALGEKIAKQCELRRRRAHNAVTRALRCGLLVRPDHCERCGRSAKNRRVRRFQGGARHAIIAHHPDYDTPLKVEWVCYECHLKIMAPDGGVPLFALGVMTDRELKPIFRRAKG